MSCSIAFPFWNLSCVLRHRDSKIPSPPPGHKWKEVRHDNKVTWLVSWTENIQGSIKYIMLNPSSRIKVRIVWKFVTYFSLWLHGRTCHFTGDPGRSVGFQYVYVRVIRDSASWLLYLKHLCWPAMRQWYVWQDLCFIFVSFRRRCVSTNIISFVLPSLCFDTKGTTCFTSFHFIYSHLFSGAKTLKEPFKTTTL